MVNAPPECVRSSRFFENPLLGWPQAGVGCRDKGTTGKPLHRLGWKRQPCKHGHWTYAVSGWTKLMRIASQNQRLFFLFLLDVAGPLRNPGIRPLSFIISKYEGCSRGSFFKYSSIKWTAREYWRSSIKVFILLIKELIVSGWLSPRSSVCIF